MLCLTCTPIPTQLPPSLLIPVFKEFNCIYATLWLSNHFPPTTLFHRRNVANLSDLYRSFYFRCSDELHCLALLCHTFTARSHHSTYMASVHHYSLRIPLVRRRVLMKQLLPENHLYVNRLMRGSSPDHYNFILFSSSVSAHTTIWFSRSLT